MNDRDYRPCRCGAAPGHFYTAVESSRFDRTVMSAYCAGCYATTAVAVVQHWGRANELVDAWNDLNRPEGQDAGIEEAFTK